MQDGKEGSKLMQSNTFTIMCKDTQIRIMKDLTNAPAEISIRDFLNTNHVFQIIVISNKQ
jgi:hypothetical protein